ncbi:hypothetical protein D3C86_2094780 [compost metagenome]
METPFKTERLVRISSRTSALLLPPGFKATSISVELGGSACSSNSARPVRRAVSATSGTFSICCSAIVPSLLLSSNEVPAGATMFTV